METKNQNKFLLQCACWDSFWCTSGFYILRPPLFNIYIYDLLFENSDNDIANYFDGNTPYVYSSNLDSVISKLQKRRISIWFHNNKLIPNTGKSHLIVRSKKNLEIQVSSCYMKNEGRVKLLGIHVNSNFNFNNQFISN